jgi:hypothetical protein
VKNGEKCYESQIQNPEWKILWVAGISNLH